MRTLNQQAGNDYDIDIAIIFAEDALPSDSYQSRKRIEKAMIEGGGNFNRDPEALTNAVRVFYSEGHHVDLAIYREREAGLDEVIEHAGSEWTKRDPMEITNWFNNLVDSVSPPSAEGTNVRKGQLRRIVRLLKAFSKSRESWDLPGGLIISVLAAECYRPNLMRDDQALLDTLRAIRQRAEASELVLSPVDSSEALTNRPVDKGRIKRLAEKIEWVEGKLAILEESECTKIDAIRAWKSFFSHEYWNEEQLGKSTEEIGEALGAAARAGSIYVTSKGEVHIAKPDKKSVKPPPQRFYGE